MSNTRVQKYGGLAETPLAARHWLQTLFISFSGSCFF
jgi:hypothetical protein